MKIAIISDIHANYDALSALPQDYDELWVLGDVVNYGPQPAECVDYVSKRASLVVSGNHDHCIAFGTDPRCAPRLRALAEATRGYTHSVLSPAQEDYLRSLPMRLETERANTKFCLLHGIPSDPLYGFAAGQSDRWPAEVEAIDTDVLLVGHTHIPFLRRIGRRTVCNPGSLGQPKTAKPGAYYAVWEDGNLELKCAPYPVEETIRKIEALPIPEKIQRDLVKILKKSDW
jgi:putative phosphoesterase